MNMGNLLVGFAGITRHNLVEKSEPNKIRWIDPISENHPEVISFKDPFQRLCFILRSLRYLLWLSPVKSDPAMPVYPTTLAILNIGRYMATTRPPIIPPRKTIMKGSIMAVRLSTA